MRKLIFGCLSLIFFQQLYAQVYQNPVTDFPCADPGILNDLKSTNQFYLTCTGGKFPIRKSPDLLNWYWTGKTLVNTDSGRATFSGYNPNWPTPNRNWAPALAKVDGRYMGYYTQNGYGGYGVVAVSETDDILNLNFFESRDNALVRNDSVGGVIDPSYFKDPKTGKHYLLYKFDGNSRGLATKIVIREMGPYGAGFVSGPRIIKTGGNTLNTLVEGQELIKWGDYYYLFYSHGSYIDSYKVKVARSKNIYGPYTGDRIILQARTGGRFYGPGHGSIARVKGKDYYFYHAYDRQQEKERGILRYGMLDRIYWQNGWPIINDGYPSEATEYAPLSSESNFPSVVLRWNTIGLKNPQYSLDVIDKNGKWTKACMNSSILKGSRYLKFDGICKSQANKNIDLHNKARFRVCAAENGRWKGGKIKCSLLKYFDRAHIYFEIK